MKAPSGAPGMAGPPGKKGADDTTPAQNGSAPPPSPPTVAVLTASSPGNNVYFGRSVAISGDVMAVGSPYDDSLNEPCCGFNQGVVYVFQRPASGSWADATETAQLTMSSASGQDHLGLSVAIDGDTIVAGASHDDVHHDYNGAVYVFTKPAGGWQSESESAVLTASDAASSDGFAQGAGWLASPGVMSWSARRAMRSTAISARVRCTSSTSREVVGPTPSRRLS